MFYFARPIKGPMTNNDVLKKLRVALRLRDDAILEILELVDFKISKSELGAFFRNEDHPNYRECGDQILRNFLNGLIIHTESFPGWDSFGGLVSHMKFIKNHHEHIAKVAFATDSEVASIIQHIGKHFVSAETKLFPYSDLKTAKEWILS